MRRLGRRWSGLVALGVVGLAAAPARAQSIPARVLILVDTSGSMVWHFDDNFTCGGDGDLNSRFTDSVQANKNFYPGYIINGVPDGMNSRLYAAKAAVTNVLNATGDVDFGLMRYAPFPVQHNGCQNNKNCCDFNSPECQRNAINFEGYLDNRGDLTWLGDCGPVTNGIATDGGQVLVSPATGSSRKVLEWVDGNEVFLDRGDGWPQNGELRANGPTPVGGSARTALGRWYKPILDYTRANPGCNPANNPLCDPQIDCRPYVYVLMTDGADTCDFDPINSPPLAVKALYDANPANRVKTYVIGVAFVPGDPATGVLNAAAANGGTVAARFANNRGAIEAALADVVASSVKYEACNGLDDTCNGLVDEGLGVWQECAAAAQCAGGPCMGGRCGCTRDADCRSGFACAAGLCAPACTAGVGACLRNGVRKCSGAAAACCKNDGRAACDVLTAGAPGALVCNGQDNNCNGQIDDFENGCMMGQGCRPTAEVCNGRDDDCNGAIDDGLIDTGRVCGLSLGVCQPGSTVCVNGAGVDLSQSGVVPDPLDHLVCVGAAGQRPVVCNGCDNDCDGLVDQPTQTCYDGPAGTAGVGICKTGLQACVATTCNPNGAGSFGACVGEIVPAMEICNGIDDDCDNTVDDVPGAFTPCCPSGRCGMGICTDGSLQCSGGMLACTGGRGPEGEICNGLDDDCNGMADDLPVLGRACTLQGSCAGTLACDLVAMEVTCQVAGASGSSEVCNGLDDDCDGFTDEPVDVTMNDPRIGKPCGNDMNLPTPCVAGKTACRGGMVICEAAVGPMPELCNCKNDNCDVQGTIDEGAACPTGTECHNCGCYAKCLPGEFPCPGGYECDVDHFCVPQGGCETTCAHGFECRLGRCVDKCENVRCPDTYVCVDGNCVGMSCVELGNCAACVNGHGERCDTINRKCVTDLCCGKTCGAREFCDVNNGQCVKTCEGVVCDEGGTCVNGECVFQMCSGRSCPERKLCDPKTGTCVPNPCSDVTCFDGQACVGGTCVQDTCPMVNCPEGYRCTTSPIDGTHACDQPVVAPLDQDQIVGAGSGGLSLGCSMAPLGSRR